MFDLFESDNRLDITLLNADAYLSSDTRYKRFFNTHCTIEAKLNGVKVTAVKVADNGDIDDWIIAYKTHILYQTEFDYQPVTRIKADSIGTSQFKLLLNHFVKIGKNDVPVNTELQLEFLARKPGIDADYNNLHKIILIGHSECTYTEEYGLLKTHAYGFSTAKRDAYAKMLKLDTPAKIFDGVMNSKDNFKDGIIDKTLRVAFERNKNYLDFNNYRNLYSQLKQMLLDVPSKFGGKEEGVVFSFDDTRLKLQREPKEHIVPKYQDSDSELEEQYWNNVEKSALEISNSIKVNSRRLPELMAELSLMLKRYKIGYTHSKKNSVHIKDDIQLKAKNLIIKRMRGNAGCLIIGKFRVLTRGHYKLIKHAIENYSRVVICLITNKNTENTRDLRMAMLRACFEDLEIIEARMASLSRIFERVPFNINVVYCGSDKTNNYQEQVKHITGVAIKEMPNTGVSTSNVINNIYNKDVFYSNTPKQVHQFYEQLLTAYASANEEESADSASSADAASSAHGTTSADIASVDNVIGTTIKRKKPKLMVL